MKRTFEMPRTSTEAKKSKSNENLEENFPKSTEAPLGPVMFTEVVNIKVEVPHSVDIETLLPTTEVNLEQIIKKEPEETEFVTLTPEIGQNEIKAEPQSEPRRLSVIERLRLNGKKFPMIPRKEPEIVLLSHEERNVDDQRVKFPDQGTKADLSKNDEFERPTQKSEELYLVPMEIQSFVAEEKPKHPVDYSGQPCPDIKPEFDSTDESDTSDTMSQEEETGEDLIPNRVRAFVAVERMRRVAKENQITKRILTGAKISLKFKKFDLILINCPLCPQIIDNSDVFMQHAFDYHKFCMCLACNQRLGSSINNHVGECHETLSLLDCVTCKFSTTDRVEWTLHLRMHMEKSLREFRPQLQSKDEWIQCPFCVTYLYNRDQSFKYHLRSFHHIFECVACGFYDANSTDWMHHLNEEHRKGITLTKARLYNQSMEGHDRDEPKIGDFSCPKCLFSSDKPLQVQMHLQKAHSDFCCVFCDEFVTNIQTNLKRHIQTEHRMVNRRKVQCSICPYSGVSVSVSHAEDYLDDHMEAKRTLLNSILAQGFALRNSRQYQPVESDPLKQEYGEEEDGSNDGQVLINAEDIKVEIDYCETTDE